MKTYKANLTFFSPNEEGKKLNFKSPTVLKEILKHIETHNSNQSRQIKILSVSEQSLNVILLAENVYKDGRDFTALSNILRHHGWLKFSSTNKLLTVTFFSEINNLKFEDLPVLPKDYDYMWFKDAEAIMNKEQTIDLLKALFVLAETDKFTPDEKKQTYANCLFRVKEALYDAFN